MTITQACKPVYAPWAIRVLALILVHAQAFGDVTDIFGSVGEFDDGYILRVTDPAPIVEEPLIPLTEFSNAIELDVANGKMYYRDTDLDAIRRSNLDGSSPETIISGLTESMAIALDLVNGRLYWHDGDVDEIKRSNLDGSSIETVADSSTGSVEDIAVDAAGGKVYWINFGLLVRANLDGSNIQGVGAGDPPNFVPGSVALDLSGGKVYWTNESAGIQRANLDGTSPESLVLAFDDGGSQLMSIALDVTAGAMYWSDFSSGLIRTANLDGTDIRTVYDTLDANDFASFFTFDPATRMLYWSAGIAETDGIVRAELPAITRLPQDLITGCGLALHNNQIYYINADRTGAQTGIGSIHRANLDGSGDQTLLSNLSTPLSLAVDGTGGKMYWTDLLQGVWRANLNGSNPQLIVPSTGFPVYLDLDRMNNKVYWSEAGTQNIRRANLDGTNSETAVPSVNARGIAIHNGLGKVYWTRFTGQIFRANLNGTNLETIVENADLDAPFGLKIDESSGIMYWTENEGGPLRRANVDGSNVEVVYPLGFPAGDIALLTQASAEVWVDFAATGFEAGTEANPFNSVQEGIAAVLAGGTIFFAGDSTDTVSSESPTINKSVTLEAVGGTVRIGASSGRLTPAKQGFIAPPNK